MMSKIQPILQFLFQNRVVVSSAASVILGLLYFGDRNGQRQCDLREKEAEAERAKYDEELLRLKELEALYTSNLDKVQKAERFDRDTIKAIGSTRGWQCDINVSRGFIWDNDNYQRPWKDDEVSSQKRREVFFVYLTYKELYEATLSRGKVTIRCWDNKSFLASLANYASTYRMAPFDDTETHEMERRFVYEMKELILRYCERLAY